MIEIGLVKVIHLSIISYKVLIGKKILWVIHILLSP